MSRYKYGDALKLPAITDMGPQDIKNVGSDLGLQQYRRTPRLSELIPYYVGLLTLLHATSEYRCQDPRDKIFALWSLAHQSLAGNFQVDYSKSIVEVYTSFAVKCLEAGDTRVLSAANAGTSTLDIPSWVPDWSVPLTSTPFWAYPKRTGRAGRLCKTFEAGVFSPDTRANFDSTRKQVSDGKELFVRGCRIGCVARTGDICATNANLDKIFSSSDNAFRSDCGIFPAPEAPSQIRGVSVADEDRYRFPSFVNDYLWQAVSKRTITRGFYENVQGRRFFKFPSSTAIQNLPPGYMAALRPLGSWREHCGLGPPGMRKGALVYVFRGFDVPFVIRKSPLDSTKYTLIGECCAEAFMQGEVLYAGWFSEERPGELVVLC